MSDPNVHSPAQRWPRLKAWFRRHRFELILAAIVTVLGSILIPVYLLPSGSKSTVINSKSTVVLTHPPATPAPKSAVEEIAQRNIWSSPPVTFSDANQAAHSDYGSPDYLPSGINLKAGPEVWSAAELGDASSGFGQVILVGKVEALHVNKRWRAGFYDPVCKEKKQVRNLKQQRRQSWSVHQPRIRTWSTAFRVFIVMWKSMSEV
jgi:hypothetical protein